MIFIRYNKNFVVIQKNVPIFKMHIGVFRDKVSNLSAKNILRQNALNYMMGELLPSLVFSMFDFSYNKRKGGRDGERRNVCMNELWITQVSTQGSDYELKTLTENKDQETSFKS